MSKITKPAAWVILVDKSVDQIVSTEREAKREVRDLKAMDCGTVRAIPFATWQDAEDYEDKARGY